MELFVPGRICLFGEHSDWAGGYRRVNPDLEKGHTLICGTEQGLYATVERHPDALVLLASTPDGSTHGPKVLPMEPAALLETARAGGFWSYIAGVAYQATIHYNVGGLFIHNDRTDLPIKKGLSSSAAICVLVARAFNRLYDLRLTVRGEMELAYQGEVTTPSRCGRMDQGCAFGNCPVLMSFDGDQLHTEEVAAGGPVHLVIADLQARKDTLTILRRLNACYPRGDDRISRGVQKLLGPLNRDVVARAAAALRAGDARTLGALMTEAQTLFDRYAVPACPEELTAPVLHRVLAHPPLQAHVWGGKGVGSQGDGSAQFVARSRADQEVAVRILEEELELPCLKLTLGSDSAGTRQSVTVLPGIPVVQRAAPARKPGAPPPVRKAVIPAAGLGTRLFPATKTVRKEFFPVVDGTGVARPAILYIVREALAARLEEVVIVVQADALDDFRRLFHEPLPRGIRRRLPRALQEEAQRLLEAGAHVSFAVQAEQEGFGHAVYQARQAIGDEPFLLMLGDHVYGSDGGQSTAAQMLDVYRAHGGGILGLRHVPEKDVVHYGVAAGPWSESGRLIEVETLIEKPAVARARAELRMPGLPADTYLALFGQYVLPPTLFDYLARGMDAGTRRAAEVGLTPALAELARQEGLLGLLIDGEAYDIGLPNTYLETLWRFSSNGSEPCEGQ